VRAKLEVGFSEPCGPGRGGLGICERADRQGHTIQVFTEISLKRNAVSTVLGYYDSAYCTADTEEGVAWRRRVSWLWMTRRTSSS
jgi:hypothetical protein